MNQEMLHTPTNKSGLSRLLLKVFLSIVLLLVVLAGGLWVWSGSNGSLATALSFAQRYLKPGQTLVATDVKGSIRHGGDLGLLRWEQDGLQAELSNVSVKWEIMPLLSGKLVVHDLKVGKVQMTQEKASVQDKNFPEGESPLPSENKQGQVGPPKEIKLPIEVNVQKMQIDSVVIKNKENSEVVSGFVGSYQFDKVQHLLTVDRVHVADGDYQGLIKLTAENPHLHVDFKGSLVTQVPESDKKVKLNVSALVAGPLNRLDVNADVQATESGAANAPKASLKAVVTPWAGALILPKADLSLQSFNVNAFWAQAPITLLSGTSGVVTSADGASGEQILTLVLNLKNSAPGRVSQKKLPFSTINGHFIGKGNVITVRDFNASTGKGSIAGSGHAVLSQGKGGAKLASWDASAKLNQLDPHLFTDDMASDALSGTVKASQKKANVIAFDVTLSAAQAANVPLFRVKNVSAQGSFENNNLIRLNVFHVESIDATISGSATTYAMDSGAVSGPMKLVAPGLVATTTLDQFAKTQGQAKVSMDLKSAELAYNWIKRQKANAGHLLEILARLKGATDRLDKVAYLTQAMPILVTGGWEKPTIKAEFETKALMQAIVEAEAKEKLNPALDKLGKSGKINETEKKILQGVGGKLGDILQKKK